MFEITFYNCSKIFYHSTLPLARARLGIFWAVIETLPFYVCVFWSFPSKMLRSAEVRDSTAPVNLPRLPRVFQISDPGFCGQDPGKRRVETGAELCWTRCRHHESLIHRRFWKIKMHKTVSKMLLRSTFLWYVSYGSTNSNFWVCGWNPIVLPSNKSYWAVLFVVLFIILYKMVLAFESVDEILWCNHSNESYWAVLSCGTVYYAVQGGSNFWVCGWNPMVWPFKWKLLSNTFLWYCLLCCTRWF